MLSICIVNWNTNDMLRDCLASIAAYPPAEQPVQVIVVDNASTDGSADMVRAEFPSVRLIANTLNAGYAAGNNQAIHESKGDYVLLLNPDTVMLADTLTNALAFFASHPDAGAVGICQLEPSGATQLSLRSFPTPEAVLWEAVGARRIFPKSRRFGAYRMSYFDYETDTECDQPMGTFLLTSRAVIEKVGGMDEKFPLFFNDVDWCWRIKEAGWKVYYTPSARIVHYGGCGTKQAPKPAMIRESHRSLIRFYEKHYSNRISRLVFALIKANILMGEYFRIIVSKLRGAR